MTKASLNRCISWKPNGNNYLTSHFAFFRNEQNDNHIAKRSKLINDPHWVVETGMANQAGALLRPFLLMGFFL
ncbi:hypothetical protein [Spirosoma aerophilum]